MQITLLNFGGFKGAHTRKFESQTLPNGEGKTTLINAYVFALSGKTLNGFVAANINAFPKEQTAVTLHHFIDLPPLRRVLNETGTTLYVGEDVATQSDFVSVLKQRGYDLDFIVACANANVLTSNGLDAETLRKILAKADVLDSEERDELRKSKVLIGKKLDVAKQHALTNIIVPVAKCEPLNEAERIFAGAFKAAKMTVNEGVVHACPHCKHEYDEKTINELNDSYIKAEAFVKQSFDEFTRIMNKQVEYTLEEQTIADAQRLLDGATKARKDVIAFTKELADVNEELRELDEQSVKNHLPEFVDVVTEVEQKNGKSKPTCTLEYQGIPLRSINHAKRIEICVTILVHARAAKGMQNVPIIVDNAEAVEHNFEYIDNVILFKARQR